MSSLDPDLKKELESLGAKERIEAAQEIWDSFASDSSIWDSSIISQIELGKQLEGLRKDRDGETDETDEAEGQEPSQADQSQIH